MTLSEGLDAMKTSEVFERAADAIEKYGHHRYDLGSTEKGVCALGAINFAASGNPQTITFWGQSTAATKAVQRLELEMINGAWEGYVAGWSDNSPTQEVLDTLRKFAKDARLEEEGLK